MMRSEVGDVLLRMSVPAVLALLLAGTAGGSLSASGGSPGVSAGKVAVPPPVPGSPSPGREQLDVACERALREVASGTTNAFPYYVVALYRYYEGDRSSGYRYTMLAVKKHLQSTSLLSREARGYVQEYATIRNVVAETAGYAVSLRSSDPVKAREALGVIDAVYRQVMSERPFVMDHVLIGIMGTWPLTVQAKIDILHDEGEHARWVCVRKAMCHYIDKSLCTSVRSFQNGKAVVSLYKRIAAEEKAGRRENARALRQQLFTLESRFAEHAVTAWTAELGRADRVCSSTPPRPK